MPNKIFALSAVLTVLFLLLSGGLLIATFWVGNRSTQEVIMKLFGTSGVLFVISLIIHRIALGYIQSGNDVEQPH